ncbi:MAG: DNA cytosine methyltransferase [Caulobacteraceae bacterium]|nr:DNA cytosine methyltransferase [Caulobacteraceae bacterium]
MIGSGVACWGAMCRGELCRVKEPLSRQARQHLRRCGVGCNAARLGSAGLGLSSLGRVRRAAAGCGESWNQPRAGAVPDRRRRVGIRSPRVRYASVCDGIGAVHVAWWHLGWECAWTSEIEPFPMAVVEHHFGHQNLGDMTKITEEMINERGPVEILVGGTPCQSFSRGGLQRGLEDPRGSLALRFVQLAEALRPKWIVWENVPGALRTNGGRDFGSIVGALAELGFGIAYRILDAKFFGVPQRRRRIFVVGCAGDWDAPCSVLFDGEGGGGIARRLRNKGVSIKTVEKAISLMPVLESGGMDQE